MTDLADVGAPRPSFLDRLGPRALRRAQPRAGVALAAAGCALAVAGVMTLAADAGESSDGSFNRAPGIVLSLLVLGAGFLVLRLRSQGPLATAGAVAAAIGILTSIGFIVVGGDDGRLDTVLALAAIAWLATYLVGPGRGRPVFLGLGLYGVWSTALQLVGAGSGLSLLAMSPLGLFSFGGGQSCSYDSFSGTTDCSTISPFGMLGFDQPDFAAIGIVSVAVGVAYLLVSQRLDRAGRRGMSSPFVLVGILAILEGLGSLAFEIADAHGIGALIIVASVALAMFGGATDRRFTTWLGAAGTAFGIGLLLLPDVDSLSTAGLVLLGAGLALVAATHLVSEQMGEPDELVPGGADPWVPRVAPAVRVIADPVVAEPDPEWADGSLLELEPLAPPPAPVARPACKAPAKKAPAKPATPAKKAVAKKKAAATKKATPKKATPVKKAAKKRPTP